MTKVAALLSPRRMSLGPYTTKRSILWIPDRKLKNDHLTSTAQVRHMISTAGPISQKMDKN